MAHRGGNYQHVATLYNATATKDEVKGYHDVWAAFGTWRVAVVDVPFVKSESQNDVLHVLEGLWRQDIWNRWYGGTRMQFDVRFNGVTLTVKPIAVENPGNRNVVLKVHTVLDKEART